MKKLFLIILMMFLTLPTSAKTLTGGVTYTVESARKEAFANVEYTIPVDIISAYFYDPGYKKNVEYAAKPIISNVGRKVTVFGDGSYGVTYYNNERISYYYDAGGKLESIGKMVGSAYPTKCLKYNIDGALENIAVYVSGEETFVYDNKKKLTGHWIGKKHYDENNNLTEIRDY